MTGVQIPLLLQPVEMGPFNPASPADGPNSAVATRGPFAAGVRGSASTTNASITLLQ